MVDDRPLAEGLIVIIWERVTATSMTSAAQARENLGVLSPWRGWAGNTGRLRGDRLTMLGPPRTRKMLRPALVARLSEHDGHLVVTGTIRPSIDLAMSMILPVGFLGGSVVVRDGFPLMTIIGLVILTLVGFELGTEIERYRGDVEALKHALQESMDGGAQGRSLRG